ncbi:probable calmodulin-like protein 5 at N-terminal half [Coccomyxa sp. Obi]|nr:probable calmodulin-like protein 5 at N-terminal half [Coccomyxa sp. Obi]
MFTRSGRVTRSDRANFAIFSTAASAEQTAQAPSWGPTTEVWTSKEKLSYETLQERFRAADLDGNGVIDREELRALLESTDSGAQYSITRWLEDNDLDKIMQNYDANNDGVIQFEEFSKLAQDNILFTGKIEEYEAAFNLVDTEGKGSVNATQLATLFQNLGHPLPYDRLTKIMSDYDASKKGQVTFSAMMRMFRDELLDLKEILEYIKMQPKEDATTSTDAAPKLHPGEVIEIESEEELDKLLTEDSESLTVLLASLTWCRPCKTLAKPLQALAQAYREVGFVKMYGNASEAAKHLFKDRLKARVTPTFYFFRNGELLHTHTGANKNKLEYYMRQFLKPRERPPNELFPVTTTPVGGPR